LLFLLPTCSSSKSNLQQILVYLPFISPKSQ
jgi:hypothetical protein